MCNFSDTGLEEYNFHYGFYNRKNNELSHSFACKIINITTLPFTNSYNSDN